MFQNFKNILALKAILLGEGAYKNGF